SRHPADQCGTKFGIERELLGDVRRNFCESNRGLRERVVSCDAAGVRDRRQHEASRCRYHSLPIRSLLNEGRKLRNLASELVAPVLRRIECADGVLWLG